MAEGPKNNKVNWIFQLPLTAAEDDSSVIKMSGEHNITVEAVQVKGLLVRNHRLLMSFKEQPNLPFSYMHPGLYLGTCYSVLVHRVAKFLIFIF